MPSCAVTKRNSLTNVRCSSCRCYDTSTTFLSFFVRSNTLLPLQSAPYQNIPTSISCTRRRSTTSYYFWTLTCMGPFKKYDRPEGKGGSAKREQSILNYTKIFLYKKRTRGGGGQKLTYLSVLFEWPLSAIGILPNRIRRELIELEI